MGPSPARLLLISALVAAAAWPQAEAQARVSNLHEDFRNQAMAALPPAGAAAQIAKMQAAGSCPNEQYRPLVHFSPRTLWMNDPNGLLYANGEYHLFFQYSPTANVPENISWGHAVSTDLVNWKELSSAGSPAISHNGEQEQIFSGSAVMDEDNTSGLGTTENPPMVAIYTSASPTKQTQSLAYSLDNGRTWLKYAGNPVLDIGEKEFRDPKVQWHAPTRRWLMAVALADERKIRFYSSPDLKSWTHMSDFGPMGAVAGQYECPDLFPLAIDGDLTRLKWVLVVNINPGGLHGGSSAQYFIGDFDGERFVPDNSDTTAIRWLDYGKDYYAAISWVNAPNGERYMIGWMSNWQYAEKTPTAPWRHAMSVPRRMSLRSREGAPESVDLIQEPVAAHLKALMLPALTPLPTKSAGTRAQGPTAAGHILVATGCDGAYYLDATITLKGGATGARFVLRASEDGSAGTSVIWDAVNKELSVDRRLSGKVDFSADFPGKHAAPLDPSTLAGGKLKLRILVDEGSVEVFADSGRIVITDTIFPETQNKAVLVKADGPAGAAVQLDNVRIRPLKPYRPECQSRELTCRLVV